MTSPKQNKDLLGKGIRSLLQSIDTDMKTNTGELKSSVVESVTSMQRIPVGDIEPNPKQPRRDFDEQSLQELAHSIKLPKITRASYARVEDDAKPAKKKAKPGIAARDGGEERELVGATN